VRECRLIHLCVPGRFIHWPNGRRAAGIYPPDCSRGKALMSRCSATYVVIIIAPYGLSSMRLPQASHICTRTTKQLGLTGDR
jgi:hypothetical protein